MCPCSQGFKFIKGGQNGLKKDLGGGRGNGVAHYRAPSRGSGGMLPQNFFFNFRPSESASGAFSDHLGMDHITNA